MQKIEMGAQLRRANRARHAIARLEQRPVEGFAVEGDEHGPLGDALGQGGEQRMFVAVVTHEQLLDFEAAGIPPGNADEKRIRARPPGYSGGLRVEEKPLARIGDFLCGSGCEQLERCYVECTVRERRGRERRSTGS